MHFGEWEVVVVCRPTGRRGVGILKDMIDISAIIV